MSAAIDRMLQAAVTAGCPRDQVENFIRAYYVSQPKQLAFHAACRECDHPNGPTEVGFGGARGPGKSHAMLAQILLDDAMRQPNLSCLLLRKVGKAVKESFEDLRLRVLTHTPHQYNRSGTLYLENGSRLVLGHFQTEGDIDSYLGLEYGVIGLEEATTLTGAKFRMIRTCNRTSAENWRPRIYLSTNSGGVGHAWFKERFVAPYRLGAETETRFIPGTYLDNRFLNPDYVKNLDGLVGWQKRAWKLGDWNISAGQFFTNFDHEVHVVKAQPVEEWWPEVWLAMDYGWTHPTVVLLMAKDLKGNTFVVDEYSASNRLPEIHSVKIRETLAHWNIREERIRQFVIGQDAYAKDQEGHTVVDSYEALGWTLTPANMARVQGATEILRRLGDVGAGVLPTLFLYENCIDLIETLPRMEHDPHRPEDVLKVDVDEEGVGGDDAYDALRYGLLAMSQPMALVYKSLSVPGIAG